ncbi:aldo/keto reductase [Pseudonocardia endophytica]|uniref:Aryl-alcohol dehydrogenase-like predicted oxidoreductase n=1 Tax=Pseudonocardia endophytica TaxID=401976 RepID=A0A4R1HYF3_PSEEN|nr:aldo/keto reductase [Pseudonocardia endophytica]TCK26175.1 aryl-alcohol dehydrogenase-like predicted oxidoreductase [Pseudonocardia endophytica]
MTTIGRSDLEVSGLCLGTNVFGWTADEPTSFALLDAFLDSGGSMVDTSDSYMAAAEGNSGGESETIIGNWLADRDTRDRVVVATKVGKLPGRTGLARENIVAAAEDSLRRLRTDRIDLYYAHADDPDTPQEEYLAAFDELVRAGKVRAIAASNFDADRLRSALKISGRDGLARFDAVQPHYNLMERDYESDHALLVETENLSCFPYFGLAKGFLTGKYRPGGGDVDSGVTSGRMAAARAEGARSYLDARGERVLGVLDEVSAAHDVPVASVSLAWLAAQPTVAAPIASARTLDQLRAILPSMDLKLAPDELTALSDASAR